MSTNTLRQQLNAIAHKRAREVARKKRIAATKRGIAVQSEFRSSSAGRT